MSIFDLFKKKKKVTIADEVESNKIRYCEKCGKPITSTSNFCGSCGNLINTELIKCPKCESYINKDSKYCYKCGANLSDFNEQESHEVEINDNDLNIVIDRDSKEINDSHDSELDREFSNILNDDYNKESADTSIETIPDLFDELIEKNDKDIIDKVMEFVMKNVDPGVYYSVIYGKYKKDFEMFNINNFREVKMEIDNYLPENYIKTDKFISIYTSEEEIKKRIIDISKNINGKFRIFELSKAAPGIQWPILEKIIAEAKQQGIFIQVDVDNNKFPFYEYKEPEEISIADEFKKMLSDSPSEKDNNQNEDNTYDELYDFIIKLLEEVDCEMISLNIVCSQLRIFNKQLFEKLDIGKDIDKLSQIIKRNLNGKLYVNKPFVAKCPVRNSIEVTCDYLRTLDEFDKREMDDFQSKIGLASHKSYEVFIQKMNDDYIRVDVTKMVKKEKFNISDDNLYSISKNLKFYFKNNKVLDTSKFRAYAMLPNLGEYEWNKYLLMGIVKAFFGDSYEIENYGKTINDMNYIIRRKNDEF